MELASDGKDHDLRMIMQEEVPPFNTESQTEGKEPEPR